jgi:hypothetical protein
MNLVGAIEILKLHKHTTDKFKHSIGDKYVSDAIDTVVSEVEKDVIMEDKLMMILRQLYDNKINIIEAFNRITVKEETK